VVRWLVRVWPGGVLVYQASRHPSQLGRCARNPGWFIKTSSPPPETTKRPHSSIFSPAKINAREYDQRVAELGNRVVHGGRRR
jgi:hypothetical protein